MTIDEAKAAVKEALKSGNATMVKEALRQYAAVKFAVKAEEEATANATYTAALEIFTPQVGQLSLG